MDLEMEMITVKRVEKEVVIKKRGARVVIKEADHLRYSIYNVYNYLKVALFCISDYKMGIPKALSIHLTIARLLCQTCHALHHLFWPFLSLSTALGISQQVFLGLYSCLTDGQHLCSWRSSSTQLRCANSSESSLLTTFLLTAISLHCNSYIQPMEDMTMLLTTFLTSNTPKPTSNINTTFNCQDEPRNVQNEERLGMVYAQNDQQTHIIPSASFMSLTHLHPTSYHPQPYNQTLQFPYVLLPEHQSPLMFPACAYQVEGSGMGTAAHNSSLMGFPNKIASNGLARDIPEGPCSMQLLGLSDFQEHRKLYLSTCKAARAKRMMARQMRASGPMNSSGGCCSSSSPSSSNGVSRKLAKPNVSQNGSNSDQEDLYTFSTPDNTKLRVLLQKELTGSDVGNNGRIILPKRAAEKSLPKLSSKGGITVVIRDVYSNHEWGMRYGFWANHKGRMYILDQFGDFVNQNRLEAGDHLTLYEDKSKNIYFSIKKTEKPTPTPSDKQNNAYYTYTRTPFSEEAMEEQNSSLQILMEELNYAEKHEANNLMTLYADSASSVDNRWKDAQTWFNG